MIRILFITIIINLLGLAASAQTISGMIPDSAYTPLLKAVRQHVFNKSNATQNIHIYKWYTEATQEDTNIYEYPYYKIDSLRNLFDKRDFKSQIDSQKITLWTKQIAMQKLKKDWDSPNQWQLSIPVFSLDRKSALIVGSFYWNEWKSIDRMFLYRYDKINGWQYIAVY